MCEHELIDPPEEKSLPDSEKKGIRVPLSLGEVREDFDKKGGICQVFDIIWNPDSVNRAKTEPSFRQIMIELSIAHIKQKKNIQLSTSIHIYYIYIYILYMYCEII